MYRNKTILSLIIMILPLVSLFSTSGLSYGISGTFLSTSGEEVNFSRFSGKPVIIDATATWCSPCEDQILNLHKVYANFSQDIGFLTLSVSPLSDTIQKMLDLKSTTQSDWEFGIDTESKFMNKMKTITLPTLYFIDEFGYLLTKWEGLTPAGVITNAVEEYLDLGQILSSSKGINLPLWSIIVVAVTFGILSALSPCLFPLFPSYVALNLKRKTSFLGSMISSTALIFGILTVLLLFALFATYTITSFLIRNYLYFVTFQAVSLIIGGILLIKTPAFLYKIRIPQQLDNWLSSDVSTQNFLLVSYIFGLIFTIIAAPCASGYFLSVMVLTFSKSIVEQLFILISYSIGAGLPILIFNLFNIQIGGKSIGNIHVISKRLSLIIGIIIITTGVWIITKLIFI